MDILIFSSFLLFFLIFSWSVFLFIKKHQVRDAKYFSYFTGLLAFWILSLSIALFSRDIELVVFWTRISCFFSLIGILFFLFFASVFHDDKIKLIRKNKLTIFFVGIVVLLLFTLPGDLIYKNVKISADMAPTGEYGLFYFLFLIIFCFLLFKSIFLFYKDYEKLNLRKRAQLKYVSFGGVVSILGGIIFDIILPLFGDERFYSLGPASFLFFVGFTSYAIVKHQLLDVKVVIQKGLIYSFLLSFIVGFYLILIFILGFFFQQSIDSTIIAAAGITVILGIYGVPIIEKYFCRITDKIFFKDKYDFKDAIYSLSEVLNRNISLKKLSLEVSHKIKEILKIKNINVVLPKEFLIFDGEEEFSKCPEEFCRKISGKSLKYNRKIIFKEDFNDYFLDQYNKDEKSVIKKNIKKNNVELMVFSFLGDKINSIFLLGEKLSGDIYSRDDIKLLETFSYQVSSALEKARLYEEVKDYSENLEKRVKERTKQIKELQEEQKQMILEISHGLQTPLTIIKGKLEDLKIKYSNHEDFKIFEKSLNRISHLIYDMLNLARLEAIDDSFQKEKINLSDLLLDQIEYFEVSLEDKKIKIDYEISPGIYVMGKREKLEELFSNLVSNAAKYMEKSSEKNIIIKAIQEDGGALVSVSDTGPGIEPEFLPHMFEKFYRAKNNMPGTGLGLAICKKIMEKHGGKIWLKSKMGEGAEFRMSFPEI